DPDATRIELRDAFASSDTTALRFIAGRIDPESQPAATLLLLAVELREYKALPEAIDLLRLARRAYPDDFRLAMTLGDMLMQIEPPRAEEAARHYEVALALRPESVVMWHGLGVALDKLGDHAATIDCFRAALRRRPSDPHLHYHLGLQLQIVRRLDEAIAS